MLYSVYYHCIKYFLLRPPSPQSIINFLKYLFNYLLLRKDIVSYFPISIVLYATKRCNLSCSFCYIGEDLNPSNYKDFELSYEKYEAIKKTPYFKNSLRVGMLGGEPFLAKDIWKILEDLKRQHKISTVVSNAMLLEGKNLELLKKHTPVALGLSLYDNNWPHVKRVLEHMNGRCFIWVQYILDRHHIHGFERVLNFLIDSGCRNIRVSNHFPNDEADLDNVIFDDNSEFIEMKKDIDKKYDHKINIDWFSPISREVKNKQCNKPFSFIHIDSNGGIGPCLMRSPDQEKFGSIYDKDGWNHQGCVDLRRDMNDNSKTNSICRNCESLEDDLYKV